MCHFVLMSASAVLHFGFLGLSFGLKFSNLGFRV